MNKSQKIQSFTLIELLVVIAIVGILSGLIILTMSGAIFNATLAKSKSFSFSLRDAMASGLVSQYNLDADASDSWGTNTGTLTGGTIISSDCVFGSCLSLVGGTTNRVSIPSSDSLNSVWNASHIFTLEAWINSSFYNAYQGIINKRASNYYSASPGGLFINTGGDFLEFLIGTGNDSETATRIEYSIANLHNTWLHVVGTSDGSKLTLYVNGNKIDQSVAFTQNPPVNSDPATIGVFYGTSRAFNGKIDNVRLYSIAIPIAQVRKNYYAGLKNLLAKGEITKQEYNQRIASLRQSLSVGEIN